MMAHELLRKAAEILAAGWIKNADAADDAGRIVPLWLGAVRAEINPQATRLSRTPMPGMMRDAYFHCGPAPCGLR